MEGSGAAKAMETAASKARRDGRAYVGSYDPATGMETAAANKARRGRRADARNSDGMELMNAAAKTAVKSAGNAGGQGRAARVGSWRRMNAAGAQLMKTLATAKARSAHAQAGGRMGAANAWAPRRLEAGVDGVRRSGVQDDGAMAMMAPNRGAAKGVQVERADPTKTVVPLIAALVPAAAVPAVVVVAVLTSTKLNSLRRRQTSERGKTPSAAVADPRLGGAGDKQ